MKKNIFEAYGQPEAGAVTVESTITPIEVILGDIAFEDAVFTAEDALSDSAVVSMTLAATEKFAVAMEPIEVAIAAGDITTENAVAAATAYGILCSDLNISDKDLESMGQSVVTTESATTYPEAGIKLTTEGAADLIKSVKAKSLEVIKRIVNWFKTVGVKLAASALSVEGKAIEVAKQVNNDLTDELVDGAEMPAEFIGSRLSVIGTFDKASIIGMLEFANNINVGKNISDAFNKDIAAGKFDELYKIKSLLDIPTKAVAKDGLAVENEYVLTVNGDSANVLVTRKNDKDALSIAKEVIKVPAPAAFKKATPLSRSDVSDIVAKIVLVTKAQKDLVKKTTDLVKMPDSKSENPKFLNEINVMLNIATSSYISIAMAAANTNRDALAIAVKSASLFKKKDAKPADKKEEK